MNERGPLNCSRKVDQSIKVACHQAVAAAITLGQLTRKPCEFCGTTTRVIAHHDDYAKPLDVRWLCPRHHISWHQAFGAPPVRRAGMHRERVWLTEAEVWQIIACLKPGESFRSFLKTAMLAEAARRSVARRFVWLLGQWALAASEDYGRMADEPSCSCCPESGRVSMLEAAEARRRSRDERGERE